MPAAGPCGPLQSRAAEQQGWCPQCLAQMSWCLTECHQPLVSHCHTPWPLRVCRYCPSDKAAVRTCLAWQQQRGNKVFGCSRQTGEQQRGFSSSWMCLCAFVQHIPAAPTEPCRGAGRVKQTPPDRLLLPCLVCQSMYKLPVCRDEIITGCWGIGVALSVFNKHQGRQIWDAGEKG